MQTASKGRYLGRVLTSRALSNFVLVESEYTAGQNLLLHSHERAFISIALQGSYLEQCGSSNLYCDVGQVIFHTAGERHSNHFFESGGRSLNLEILPHFAERLRNYGVDTAARITLRSRHYMQLGLKLQAEAFRYDSVSELAIESLAMEILSEMIRSQASKTKPLKEKWLERVNMLLHDRYRESVSLKEIAEYARVHPVHLARAFRQRYECTIGEYVRRLRVASAMREITGSDLSIAEIANRNGFADQSHLCRMIRQHTGRSPRQLRTTEEKFELLRD